MTLPSMPIRLRLTLLYALVLSLMLLIFGGALYGVVRVALYSEMDRTLRGQADETARRYQIYLDTLRRFEVQSGTPEGAGATEPILGPIDSSTRQDLLIELRPVNQPLVLRSRSLRQSELPLSAEVVAQAESGIASVEVLPLGGEPYRLYTAPVLWENRVVAVASIGRSLTDIQDNLRLFALVIALGSLVTIALTVLAGAWMAEKALAPVDNVTTAALHISRAEDLSSRLPDYRPRDEIGRLIAAFNEMLGRLEDVFRDQQRFVADVSHELRTPLTALQGNLDLVRRGAYNPDEQQQALATLESEVERLNRLVSDLLLLARADGGERLALEQVELDTLLLEAFRQGRLIAQASNNNVRLRLGHEDQATIVGDSDRLRQLLLNLVANAINYTPEGEVVLSLWTEHEEGRVRITVQDTGIGIPAESIPLLFHRFYRADKARSREKGGTGLGLAIVQWIVQMHGGTIDIESEEGVGSTFTVTLPLPTAEALAAARPTTGGHRVVSRGGR